MDANCATRKMVDKQKRFLPKLLDGHRIEGLVVLMMREPFRNQRPLLDSRVHEVVGTMRRMREGNCRIKLG